MINLYSIHDALAEEFGPIFQAKNHGVASRHYNQLMKANNVERSSEFKLYLVGTFDTDGGYLSMDTPEPTEIRTDGKLDTETDV